MEPIEPAELVDARVVVTDLPVLPSLVGAGTTVIVNAVVGAEVVLAEVVLAEVVGAEVGAEVVLAWTVTMPLDAIVASEM